MLAAEISIGIRTWWAALLLCAPRLFSHLRSPLFVCFLVFFPFYFIVPLTLWFPISFQINLTPSLVMWNQPQNTLHYPQPPLTASHISCVCAAAYNAQCLVISKNALFCASLIWRSGLEQKQRCANWKVEVYGNHLKSLARKLDVGDGERSSE